MPNDMLERAPPSNLEAEKGFLGSLILDPTLMVEAATALKPADFFNMTNRHVWQAMLDLHGLNRAIDVVTLLDRIGDAVPSPGAVLNEMAMEVPTASNWAWYARLVRESSRLRSAIQAATGTLRDAHGGVDDAQTFLVQQAATFAALAEETAEGGAVPLSSVMTETIGEVRQRMADPSSGGLKTGWLDLDRHTGGMFDRELIVIAARPSMGKSAFAGQLATYVASGQHPTLFVSLEMGRTELAMRMIAGHARSTVNEMRSGQVDELHLAKLERSAATLGRFPLFIDDRPAMLVGQIAAQARRIQREHGLKLIVVDYLQYIKANDPREQRHLQVGQITRDLKALAKTMNLPVIVLAQLNRATEQGRDFRPKLSHLRESGAIEADADVVWFIHRPEYYEPNNNELKGLAEIVIAKARQGPVGDVKLTWDAKSVMFRDYSSESSYTAPWQPRGGRDFDPDESMD